MNGDVLLTPPASAASPSPSTASLLARISANLPSQRTRPLLPGSAKEIQLIHYLDGQLERVYRRYEKRIVQSRRTENAPLEQDDTPGYETMDEVVEDLDPLVDVVWVSKTPSLQTAYLLSIAGYVASYITDFPFTPTVFPLLNKIDQAFAALLSAPTENPSTSTTTRSPSRTDKVRIKSLTEETRVAAVNAATQSGWSADLDDSDDELESEVSLDDIPQTYDDSAVSAGLGRVYKSTIEILGDSLL